MKPQLLCDYNWFVIPHNQKCNKQYLMNFSFTMKSQFKTYWDLLIIVLAVWNGFQLPIEFAWPEVFEGKRRFSVSDRLTDLLFIIDIFINFRTQYRDLYTDEVITDTKKIAINYMKGRFWVDLMASIPFDVIVGWFSKGGQANSNLKLVSMIKLTRLLRLGRMVTYLKASKSFALGAKMG